MIDLDELGAWYRAYERVMFDSEPDDKYRDGHDKFVDWLFDRFPELITELAYLRKEVAQLAIESVEREKVLAKLEAEVAAAAKNAITLPFKIGDTVYVPGCRDLPYFREYFVEAVYVEGIQYEVWENDGEEKITQILVNGYLYGDEVYATREEAGAALKKLKGDTP